MTKIRTRIVDTNKNSSLTNNEYINAYGNNELFITLARAKCTKERKKTSEDSNERNSFKERLTLSGDSLASSKEENERTSSSYPSCQVSVNRSVPTRCTDRSIAIKLS